MLKVARVVQAVTLILAARTGVVLDMHPQIVRVVVQQEVAVVIAKDGESTGHI